MSDGAWLAIPLGLLIWAAFANDKKVSWIPIHMLMKKTTTRKAHVLSVTIPRGPKKKARKR